MPLHGPTSQWDGAIEKFAMACGASKLWSRTSGTRIAKPAKPDGQFSSWESEQLGGFWCFKLWVPFAVDWKLRTKPVQCIDVIQGTMVWIVSTFWFTSSQTQRTTSNFCLILQWGLVLKTKFGSVWWNLGCFRCPTRWIEAKVVHHDLGICAISSVLSFESAVLFSTGMFKLHAPWSMSQSPAFFVLPQFYWIKSKCFNDQDMLWTCHKFDCLYTLSIREWRLQYHFFLMNHSAWKNKTVTGSCMVTPLRAAMKKLTFVWSPACSRVISCWHYRQQPSTATWKQSMLTGLFDISRFWGCLGALLTYWPT